MCLSVPCCKGAWGLPPSLGREHTQVTRPPAPQSVPSCAGPGRPTSQTTVFESLQYGSQMELLPWSALTGGVEGHHLLLEGEATWLESGAQLAEWGGGPLWTWAEVCPRPTGCPLRGCHAGSGSAGVEGGGRLHGGVSLPAGIGRLEPAALALAGRTQSKSAQPPQCQGREQACSSRSASVGGAFVPTWRPRGLALLHPHSL